MKFHRAVMTYLLLEGLSKACSGKESGSHHLRSKAESEYLFPSSGRILARPDRTPDTNENAPPYCPGTVPDFTLTGVGETSKCVSVNKDVYGCTANDLSYLSCKLVDPGGGCFTGCTGACGQTTSVKLQCLVKNGSNSARTVAWVLAEVLTRPSDACPSPLINATSCTLAFCADGQNLTAGQEIPVTFPDPFEYTCGSVLSFRGNNVTAGGAIGALILGSAETSATCANAFGTQNTCSGALGSKCDLPAGSLPITPPLSLSKLDPAAVCVPGTSPREVSLRFSIVGGTKPYTVSIKCSYDTSNRVLDVNNISPSASFTNGKLSAEGTYTYTGPECFTGGVKGFFTVDVSDNSTATNGTPCLGRSVTIDDPGCCKANIACKASTPPSTTVNGCTADQFPAVKTDGAIFDLVTAEKCGNDLSYPPTTFTDETIAAGFLRTYTYFADVNGTVFNCTETAVVTPPLSLSTTEPAVCVPGTSNPRQVKVNFSILGGNPLYTVSIKCSKDTSNRVLDVNNISPSASFTNGMLSAKGSYNYTGPECLKGSFTITVSDNSTATDGSPCAEQSGVIADPGCCVVNFPCKALTPPSTIVNGCTDDQFPPAKTRAEIFDLPNAEYCGDTETFSSSNTTTGSLCNEWTRTYTYTMSTEGSEVFTCTEIAVVEMQNIPTMEPLQVEEECGGTPNTTLPSATDQCGRVLTPTMVGSRNGVFDYTTSSPKTCGTANNVKAVKMFTEEYIAMDACSNSKTVAKTITVVDTTKPSGRKLCNNPSTNLNCGTLAVPAVNSCVLADSCFGDLTGVFSCAVNNTAAEMVRTWTFTDPCGNTADEPHTATYKFAV